MIYVILFHRCQYENIDIKNMTLTCYCQIKTQLTTEVSEPVFKEVIKNTFKDSWCIKML